MRTKKDKISIVPSIQQPNGNLLDAIGKVRWTNKHDCPDGYVFNDSGYVQTDDNRLQISVNMMPFMLPSIGEFGVLYQNAIALRILNHNKQIDIIKQLLKYRFYKAYFRLPDMDILDKAVEAAYALNSVSDIVGTLNKSIFCFHDIWYSESCTEGSRKQIQKLLRNDYIDKSRQLMTIATKYKTKDVAEFADTTLYAVNCYWSDTGLDKNTRTIYSVIEAIEELSRDGKKVTTREIAATAGMSGQTTRGVAKMIDIKNMFDGKF